MPRNVVTPTQKALLVQLSDGRVIRGALGELPLRPNRRIFRDQDGEYIEQGSATSLLKRGYIKVIASSGEDPPHAIDCMITTTGRDVAQHGGVAGRSRKHAPARVEGR